MVAAGPYAFQVGDVQAVRLVAQGLSNKEIARRLHLSLRTVESHISHVLTKTGLVLLATWARDRDI